VTDSLNTAVQDALTHLDGSLTSAVSLLTGLSAPRLNILGGINETPVAGPTFTVTARPSMSMTKSMSAPRPDIAAS
jgi:hypothetical protein